MCNAFGTSWGNSYYSYYFKTHKIGHFFTLARMLSQTSRDREKCSNYRMTMKTMWPFSATGHSFFITPAIVLISEVGRRLCSMQFRSEQSYFDGRLACRSYLRTASIQNKRYKACSIRISERLTPRTCMSAGLAVWIIQASELMGVKLASLYCTNRRCWCSARRHCTNKCTTAATISKYLNYKCAVSLVVCTTWSEAQRPRHD